MVQINEINISVPEMNEVAAGELGRQIGERMAEGFARSAYHGPAMINELNVQIQRSVDMGQIEIADQIAVTLLQQLNML
jgi:hypothetical protein